MKGFKDSSNKFHPITDYKKGTRKSRDQKAKTQGVRLKRTDGSRVKTVQFKVWKYDDAPEEIQEKIIEKLRSDRYESGDDWFAQGDWLLDYDMFKWDDREMYYEVASNRGTDYLQFKNLEVKDDEKFRKLLGVDKLLWKNVYYSITNPSSSFGYEHNTTIEFQPDDPEKEFTVKQREKLETAKEKFDDVIHESLVNLTNSFEDQFTDETLAEDARANEWEFNEDGEIA